MSRGCRTRLLAALTGGLVLASAHGTSAQEAVALSLVSEPKEDGYRLSVAVANATGHDVCVPMNAFAQQRIQLARRGAAIRMKPERRWMGRPPYGCLTIRSGESLSDMFDLSGLFASAPRPGDNVCYQMPWGPTGGIVSELDHPMKQCVVLPTR